ncbi:Mur ligase domain-containing protein [Antrihabitans stalagmiti]|uniref:Mur ligase domain-containing protein n=1 Tax=Antrihabitans stalagmiti TaxID=2799499 RepID=UPI0027DCA88D|nr:Mur ligase domain-containing protein [Antrihabitans stalagmiti]
MTCDRLPASLVPTGSSLAALAATVGARYRDVAVTITGASDDSRSVEPGDLYIALPGDHVHGLDFEADAFARGAAAVLSDRPSTLLPTIASRTHVGGPVR